MNKNRGEVKEERRCKEDLSPGLRKYLVRH